MMTTLVIDHVPVMPLPVVLAILVDESSDGAHGEPLANAPRGCSDQCPVARGLTGNCDFPHRGIVRGASPERPDAFDVLVETLDEALVA